MPTPTALRPIIQRGELELDGKDNGHKEWVENADGSLLKIIFGETEYKGKVKQKQICFGREKATALLNARDAIKEFAQE